MVRLEHTVGRNLVDYIQEVLNLSQRELNIAIHLTATHQRNVGSLCVNEYTCHAERTQNNGIGLPAAYVGNGCEILHLALLFNDTDRSNLRDGAAAVGHQLLPSDSVGVDAACTAGYNDNLVGRIQTNPAIDLGLEIAVVNQDRGNDAVRDVPLHSEVVRKTLGNLEVVLNLLHLRRNIAVVGRPNLSASLLEVLDRNVGLLHCRNAAESLCRCDRARSTLECNGVGVRISTTIGKGLCGHVRGAEVVGLNEVCNTLNKARDEVLVLNVQLAQTCLQFHLRHRGVKQALTILVDRASLFLPALGVELGGLRQRSHCIGHRHDTVDFLTNSPSGILLGVLQVNLVLVTLDSEVLLPKEGVCLDFESVVNQSLEETYVSSVHESFLIKLFNSLIGIPLVF